MANYKIKKGDTLSQIAKDNGTTVAEIAKANNIQNVDKIYAGQTITIPGQGNGGANRTVAGSDAMKNPTINTGTGAATIIGQGAKPPTTTAPTMAAPSTVLTKPEATQGMGTAPQNTPSTTKQPAKTNGTTAANMNFNYADYSPSQSVIDKGNAVNAHNASKPGEYVSQYDAQIDAIMNKILNREDFSYDLNGDALYKQYAEQYSLLGKMAMMDTMGQAAALTGGYGNSYASTAGNQAYQAYLQQLNDIVPELYGMALDRYNAEGDEMYRQYSMLGEADDRAYGRYQDELSAWLTERDYLTNQYNAERDYDYGIYDNERDQAYAEFSDNRSYAYQSERDAVADAQWQAEYDEALRQYNEQFEYEQQRDAVADEWAQKEYDEALRQYNEQFEYQKDRDAVGDARYEEELQYQMERDALSDARYEEQQKAKQSAETGESGIELQHVSSMSSKELVETMQEYSDAEDEDGLAAFLDDCVYTGRLTEEQADNYYAQYKLEEEESSFNGVKKNVPAIMKVGGGGGTAMHTKQ